MEPPIDVPVTERVEEPQPQQATQTTNTATPLQQPIAMPRPEDIQQLLENPLVKNLLTNFIQNAPH
jgi:hypothetical protein